MADPHRGAQIHCWKSDYRDIQGVIWGHCYLFSPNPWVFSGGCATSVVVWGIVASPIHSLLHLCILWWPGSSALPDQNAYSWRPFLALYTQHLVCDIDTNPSTLMKALPAFIFRCSHFPEITQWLTSPGAFSVGEKQRKMCVWLCDNQESIPC